MEIHALKVTITEQDLNDLAKKHLPKDQPVEELRLAISPEGVSIRGEYPLFVPVAFETVWELSVRDRHVFLRLTRFRAMGMPVSAFRGLVMNIFSTLARKEKWVHVQDDCVRLDVEGMLASEGLPTQANLRTIRCEAGRFIVEAGNL
jgi:hypothetical protein